MKPIRKTIETLAGMDPVKVGDAKQGLLRSGFIVSDSIDDNTMFIFPDGSILGAPGGRPIGNDEPGSIGGSLPNRHIYHDRILDVIDEPRRREDDGIHVMHNERIATRYNLIVVSAYHSTKWLYIPNLVEPTPEQWATVYKFYQQGYIIDSKDFQTHKQWNAYRHEQNMKATSYTEALKYKMKSDFERARQRYTLPILTPDLLDHIEQMTLLNIAKGRYPDQVEMISVDILNNFAEYDRIDQPLLGAEHLAELADSIIIEGFKEYLFIEFNPYNGFVKLGEGNHRLAIANMLGIKDVPVLALRSQYLEPHKYGPGKVVDQTQIKFRQQDETGTYYASVLKPSEVSSEFKHS